MMDANTGIVLFCTVNDDVHFKQREVCSMSKHTDCILLYPNWRIKRIAKAIIEYMINCEDGTEICTSQLAAEIGYDTFPEAALWTLEEYLYRLAPQSGLILDNSKTQGMEEGLPFNVPFVIRHKR